MSNLNVGNHDADADSLQRFDIELNRDSERAFTGSSTSTIRTEAGEVRHKFEELRARMKEERAERSDTITRLNNLNRGLWESSNVNRETIVARVVHALLQERSTQSRLRLAMFAVAAIPEVRESLNTVLRNAIVESRRYGFFTPPGAKQIWGVAFDPSNPHRAAAGDENGIVWLWDPLARTVEREYSYSSVAPGVVNGVAFNGDGTLIAAAYRSAGAVVWKIGVDTPLCPLRSGEPGRHNGAYSVAFSRRILAVASSDRAVHLWDLSKSDCPEIREKIFHRNDLIFGVAFSPDGKLLAAASADGTVAVWDVDNPDEWKEFRLGKSMFAVAFSPDGKNLAATAADGRGYLWSVGTWKQSELPSGDGTVGQVSFSPDSSMVVATAGGDASAIVTKLGVESKPLQIGGGRPGLFGVTFSPDAQYLLTGGNLDGQVRVWAVGENKVIAKDRTELLQEGLLRIGLDDLNLDPNECALLRGMKIPIFDLAELEGHSVDCAFPLLVP